MLPSRSMERPATMRRKLSEEMTYGSRLFSLMKVDCLMLEHREAIKVFS